MAGATRKQAARCSAYSVLAIVAFMLVAVMRRAIIINYVISVLVRCLLAFISNSITFSKCLKRVRDKVKDRIIVGLKGPRSSRN